MIIQSVKNVITMTTKETKEIMEHQVSTAHKDHMGLRVHQDKKVTQVAMENLEMMVTMVNLDMMANLESVTIDQESQ